jgi:3-hydroxyisobutyrate dehydrogenase
MQVGFIGLGIMGAGMAANLQKAGYKLVVHDIRQDAATPHLKAGAKWSDSPKALAAQCQVIFTSLPGPPEVEAVALGTKGLIEGMEKGSAWFDLTTNSPTLVRRLHKIFSERGSHLLDAPVSGGPQGAKSGKLAVWVGGDEDIFHDHKKVLDAFSDAARYIGPIGAGSVAKLAACDRAWPRAGGADAACQHGIRRNDGGAQPWLGEPRQSITSAAPA